MALLLSNEALRARAAMAGNELAPLANGLAAELTPLYDRELYIPREKALLSREGGRCPRDGSTLEFDPFSPDAHRCPTCGNIYTGELHHRFWVFWYQLWIAERAVHGALLANVRGDARAGELSAAILARYADEYLRYPNRDNVLGPTRLFFSTYLESIWLLNVSIAIDLLESCSSAHAVLGDRVRERIVEPSSRIIGEYDEGASNRQVWNDAALIAANRLLGRWEAVEEAMYGPSGVGFHLEHGLLADGTWYEGENYHLFAHRGLWYCITMAEEIGLTVTGSAQKRFDEGFATPFLTALPDMTLPSRRDSQYAISLRQPRFAELCELGLGRQSGKGDPRLRGVLHRLYQDVVPRRETGRARTTADVERNLPATALSRADLGWRSLLFARAKLPHLEPMPLGSVLLDAQGIAVFRREQERIYVALDYGTSGGGHGHPDRLNLLLSDGSTRWLDDMGTGSYVDPSLHWYRSTLAHNAPLFNGVDQQRVDGQLEAFDDRGDAGWISASVLDLFPGAWAMRTLVVMPEYVLDMLSWEAGGAQFVDLPIHIEPETLSIDPETSADRDAALDGAAGELRDSLGVLDDVSARPIGRDAIVRISASESGRAIEAILQASSRAVLYRTTGPGAPGQPLHPFLVLRVTERAGSVCSVWNWSGDAASLRRIRESNTTVVEVRGGPEDHHSATSDGWRIVRARSGKRTTIDLGGRRGQGPPNAREVGKTTPSRLLEISTERPREFELGQESYRRSEESWEEAGRPTARLRVTFAPNELAVDIVVSKAGELTFAPAAAKNPLDNESADINGDGVQLYVVDRDGSAAWVLIPDREQSQEGVVRGRPIDGWLTARAPTAAWRRTQDGYVLSVKLSLTPERGEFSLGVVVNEKPVGRDRRRGQLVLGGHANEFVYLRGDREERDRLPRFRVTDFSDY